MSKFEPQVGDDFPLETGPLDESLNPRSERRGRHRHHHRMHRHGHRYNSHHHQRGGFGLGRFALLLVAAGIVALIVNHQMTAAMAYGLIGTGACLLVLMIAVRVIWHRRFHRRMQQVS
jgi:hypothetical protein